MSGTAGLALALAALLGGARESLEMRLTRIDDPALRQGTAQALSRGVKVRLILSPREKSSRQRGDGLRSLGLQLRWSAKDGDSYVIADEQKVCLGGFDGWAA